MDDVELFGLEPHAHDREQEPGERPAAVPGLQHLQHADGDERQGPEPEVANRRRNPELVEREDDADEDDKEADDQLRRDAETGGGGSGGRKRGL